MAIQLTPAQKRFHEIKEREKQRAILQKQIGPIMAVSPKLTPGQAKKIFDRAQQFKKA